MLPSNDMQLTSTIPTPEYFLHLLWPAEDDGSREADAWAIVMPASAGKREALLKAADFDQTWIIQELAEGNEINWLKEPLRPYLTLRTNSFDFIIDEGDTEDAPTT